MAEESRGISKELESIIMRSATELSGEQNGTRTPVLSDLNEHEAAAMANFYGLVYETAKQRNLQLEGPRRYTVIIYIDRKRRVMPNA